MSELEEKIVSPKPGIFVLDGMIKIERYDDLNYIVKVRSETPIKDRVNENNKSGVRYVYKSDGYKQYGNSYFPSVKIALAYVANKVIPDLALSTEGRLELDEYVDKIQSLINEIIEIGGAVKVDE